MGQTSSGKLSPVQHLWMAVVKLRTIHARLAAFGEAAGEDPKARERVEKALERIGEALEALSAHDEPPDAAEEHLPF